MASRERAVRSKPLTKKALRDLIKVERSNQKYYFIDMEHTAFFQTFVFMVPNKQLAHQVAGTLRDYVSSLPVPKQHRFFERFAWLEATGILQQSKRVA